MPVISCSNKQKAVTVNPPVTQPFVYIVSSALNSLPTPGNRVGTGDATNMPKIEASGINPAITNANGAHHYRFVGIEIRSGSGNNVQNIVSLGVGATLTTDLPNNIIFDRCYIRNNSGTSGRRGVWLNVINGAVIDSYVSGFREAGSDSQAILISNTPGPCKIVNNYLEAASENFHVGGTDPSITNCIPADIEFRRNYCFKPVAWIGAGYNVKNLFEVKNVQRILVEGNVMENNWADGQDGRSFLITPRNQNGAAPWSGVQDVTARYNKIVSVEGGFNISGADDVFSSQVTDRVSVYHNFLTIERNLGSGNNKLTQFVTSHNYQAGGHPKNVQFTNNTLISDAAGGSSGVTDSNGTPIPGFVYKNNITTCGGSTGYGFTGAGTGEGNPTLAGHYSSPDYTYNGHIDSPTGSSAYPATNLFVANVTAANFTNAATNDYSLTVSSPFHNAGSDGADMGANWTTLNALTLHSVDGQWGSEPATYTDRAYTNAEMPRTYMTTTYQAQTGTTWNCSTAADLTNALANCQLGDTIVLTAGSTYVGNFTLRNI